MNSSQPLQQKTRSVRTLFLLAMTILIFVLSVPLLISGGTLMDRIIRQLGSEILTEKLTALINPVAGRYEKLQRIGLEDSLVHRQEILEKALDSYAAFQYMETGEVFVISRDGDLLLSPDFSDNDTPEFKEFLQRLTLAKQGFLDFTSLRHGKELAAYQYFAPWDSYIGLSVSQAELFAPRTLFLKINLLVLAAVLILAVVFTFGLQLLIITPLIAITNFATRVSEGDLESKIKGRFVLELGVLKNHITKMVSVLSNNVEEADRQLELIQQREVALEEALEELRESEGRYRVIFNAPSDAIFIHEAESGAVVDVNQAMLTMYGYSKEESTSLPLENFSSNRHPYTQEEAGKRLAAAINEGPQLFEWEAKNKAGDLFWVEVGLRYTEFHNEGYVIAVVRNIDARKKAEGALAAEKEQLAVTLRSIGDGVITTDTEGRVMLMNTVAEKLTGWSQSAAQGRSLPEIFHIIDEKTGEPLDNPASKVMKTGLIVELANHTILISRNGKRHHIADSGAPIRDMDSQTIGVVLVFRDVTEKIRTAEEMLKVKKLESVGVLAAGIAHDFNNLLAAIIGNLDLARSQIHNDPQTQQLIEEAENASLQAKDLTQQLLTFARGGAPVRQTSSISEVIKESAAFVMRGSNVQCTFDIQDDIQLVDIDKGQISQVIQNLLINARQAMPGSGSVTITCRNVKGLEDEQADFVSMQIADTGPGIPSDLLESIFDPYFTTKDEGSGLGLAVCHSIIAKHDGRIHVSSQAGEGATFTILLPASEETLLQKQEPEAEMQDSGTARILIMDDEEMVRTIAEKILSHYGHETVSVTDGQAAIDAYKDAKDAGNGFDLAIMDLTIPGGMGGRDAVTEILAFDPEAQVIVASGYSNDPIMANFRDYGFAGVVAKPFRMDALNRTIQGLLAESRQTS